MAGAELRPSPRNEPFLSNRLAILLNAIAGAVGEGFVAPLIVVTAYISLQTDNLVTIGAVPALSFGAWNIGALLGGSIVSRRPRRLPWTFAANLVRTGMMSLTAWVAYQDDVARADKLRSLLIAYAVFAAASGFASASNALLLRASIESVIRSRVLMLRSMLAAAVACLSGLVLREMFAAGELTTDRAFAYAFVAAAAAFGAATFFVVTIRETAGAIGRPAPAPGGTAAHQRSIRAFWRFLGFRIMLASAAAADGFLIVYGRTELDMPLEHLGFSVIAMGLSMLAGHSLWRIARSPVAPRSALQIAALLRIIPPLMAVSIPYLRDSEVYAEHSSGNATLHWLIVASFVPLGLATASVAFGTLSYLATLSPGMTERFTSMTNVVLAAASLLGLAGGWVAKEWGFDVLFATVAGLSFAALLTSGMLTITAKSSTTRGRGSAPAAIAWRPHRIQTR